MVIFGSDHKFKITLGKGGDFFEGTPLAIDSRIYSQCPGRPAVVPVHRFQSVEDVFGFHSGENFRMNNLLWQAQKRIDNPVACVGQKSLSTSMYESKRKSHLDAVIGRKAGSILEERRVPVTHFAKQIGIDDAQLRRLLSGENRWNTWHIEVVAIGLGISPADLLEDRPRQIVYQSPPTLNVQKVDRFKRFDETFAQESYLV